MKRWIALVFGCFVSCRPAGNSPQAPERVVNTGWDEDHFLRQRKAMVQEQIIERDIKDQRVIRAMEKIPRHLFVPESAQLDAYQDKPVPIGHGQTISQPYIVAYMTETLDLKKGEKVLEIGTGSGYQAAVLNELGAETYSVEIVPDLTKFAEENLKKAGIHSVHVKTGDGFLGWKEHSPYDAVIVTCSPENIPRALEDQLKEGGRIVIPLGPENKVQELCLFKKICGKLVRHSLIPVRFVPMVGESQGNRN